MADRLAALLDHFSVSARVFNTSALCGITDVDGDDMRVGQLHLIRRGEVEVFNRGSATIQITEPTLLLYPLPMPHRFVTHPDIGADFVCANLQFDGGAANPIAASLPGFVCLPLKSLPHAEPILEMLFQEAFSQYCGRMAMLNRLMEIVLIQILRYLMEAGSVQAGMLAGMAHPRLRLALIAMHEQPAREWTLEDLAGQAGMSRSVFANAFRQSIGTTPGAYLQRWRISLAQQALLRGRPVKWIADTIGYGSEAAFSRAFKASCGLSPRQWSLEQKGIAH